MRRIAFLAAWSLIGVLATGLLAQEPFSKLVGPVTVAPVKPTAPLEVPYITWGGDVPTFHANGGLQTKPGTHLSAARA